MTRYDSRPSVRSAGFRVGTRNALHPPQSVSSRTFTSSYPPNQQVTANLKVIRILLQNVDLTLRSIAAILIRPCLDHTDSGKVNIWKAHLTGEIRDTNLVQRLIVIGKYCSVVQQCRFCLIESRNCTTRTASLVAHRVGCW